VSAKAKVRDLFDGMNGTERDFAIQLEARKRAGDIREWHFEGITLKLADDCRYTPDFMVVERDWTISFSETKGFWREDAKIKIRVAAKMYPFKFTAHRKNPIKSGGGWTEEEF
jgi:hypothetical protein